MNTHHISTYHCCSGLCFAFLDLKMSFWNQVTLKQLSFPCGWIIRNIAKLSSLKNQKNPKKTLIWLLSV